jgi:ArsR family transcriptional regulator, arsenate/arsenite/antimonite-responsive transcriptional repressor
MEQTLVSIFKALSNEQRLKLFKNIYEWEKNSGKAKENAACCSGIEKAFTKACGCMDLSRSTISHHLKELQNAGLITCTRSGQTISCKINQEAIELIKQFMD